MEVSEVLQNVMCFLSLQSIITFTLIMFQLKAFLIKATSLNVTYKCNVVIQHAANFKINKIARAVTQKKS